MAYALTRLRAIKENSSAWSYLLWWARVADAAAAAAAVAEAASLTASAPASRLAPVMLARLRAARPAVGGES